MERDDLRKSPRTPDEILQTGAAWISEFELETLVNKIKQLQAERDQLKAENDHLRQTLTGRPSKELYEACMTELAERGKILDAVCAALGIYDYNQILAALRRER